MFAVDLPGDAEVRQEDVAFTAEEQDVAGLDVTVDDSLRVGVVQCRGNLPDDVQRLFRGESSLQLDEAAQVGAARGVIT